MKIGFVGVGRMGLPLAGNLLEAGHEVTAYDLDQVALEAIVARGADAAESLPSLARGAEVVMTALPSPAISKTVVTGPEGLLAGAPRQLAPACASRGVKSCET